MAHAVAYKNISVEDESSFGASTGGLVSRLRITSESLSKNVNKAVVEDTMSTVKGRDRIVSMKTTVEGDISGYGTPRNLHEVLELANGVVGTSATMGGSVGVLMTYNQNTSGTFLSKTVNVDRNNSQDKFQGVVGQELSLKASDGLLEWTLKCIAKDRVTGIALADNNIGETIKPFTFGDITVTLAQGDAYSAQVTHPVSEWELTYNNGLEATHLSGSNSVSRIDPKVPTVKGKFKIFHEGSSWVTAVEGNTNFYLRIDGVLPSYKGLINGASAYRFRVDVPKVELFVNTRDYSQNEFSVEDIEFEGILSTGQSALWIPSITADNGTII